MPLLATILTATAPPTPVVLGLQLEPYSVGHALLLHRLGSPFISGGPVSMESLAEAVLVCAQPVEESLKTIRSRFKSILFFFWARKIRKLNGRDELEKFQLWIGSQSTAPEILIDPKEKSRSLSMPWPERIIVALLDHGVSEESAIAMPVADAERLVLTHAELHGHVELWSDKMESAWQVGQRSN